MPSPSLPLRGLLIGRRSRRVLRSSAGGMRLVMTRAFFRGSAISLVMMNGVLTSWCRRWRTLTLRRCFVRVGVWGDAAAAAVGGLGGAAPEYGSFHCREAFDWVFRYHGVASVAAEQRDREHSRAGAHSTRAAPGGESAAAVLTPGVGDTGLTARGYGYLR